MIISAAIPASILPLLLSWSAAIHSSSASTSSCVEYIFSAGLYFFVITNGARDGNYNPLITDKTDPDYIPSETRDVKALDSYLLGADPYVKYDETVAKINYSKLGGFKENTKFKNEPEERVLSDENGNVIIGVRSEFGIHLMIVEKSAYDFNAKVKLEDYYTTALPKDDDYPEIPAGEHTYVDFIYSDEQSEYKTRSDKVKEAIKGFDSTYDYRLYAELTKNREKDFSKSTNDLLSAIDDYIDVQRDKNNHDQEKGMFEVWKTYYELLLTQDSYRKATEKNRILPEGCKIGFTKDGVDKSNYEQGGKCYVK